jgi:eukaryotic-like serine/threonine-protein kinase
MGASKLPTARFSSADETHTAVTATRGSSRRRSDARIVLERYRLHRRLGAGGFGTVWMARDERLERDVAVKIVPRERVLGGRFEREARAAARLSHPGIVTLYEAAVDDEGAYLVSELVRGETLDELLDAGRLSDRDIAKIAIVLCDALAHAHAQAVVHRDVKPSNVLVPEHPASPAQLAKLTDFGVARVIGGRSLTHTGDVVGTAAYMAPEQAEGLEAGAAADLYSLALVSYEALTGINPVRTGTAAQRARRLGAYLPPLRRQRRDLPQGLGRAVDLALRPRPRERGSLAELRAALAEALPLLHDHTGVVASPWPRRTQTVAGAAELGPEPWSDRGAGADRPRVEPDGVDARRLLWPARALSALGTAAVTGWMSATVLPHAPIAPAAAALAAAVLAAALPRIGWAVALGCLTTAAAAAQGPGAAVVIALGGLVPLALMPLSGPSWSLAAGAPALAMIGLGGGWPALAARAGVPWRRAALGATGWVWIVLASSLNGNAIYLRALPGSASLSGWSGSLHQTATLLREILSSGALAGAPVWALAALTLPWLANGRSFPSDAARIAAWAAALVLGTTAAIGIVQPARGLLAPQSALVGGIAAALIAFAPRLPGYWHTGRARAPFP